MDNPNLVSEVKGYVGHALNEFQAMGWLDADGNYDDDLQELVCQNTLELLELLGKHAYSGGAIDYALSLFHKLAMFKPLGALTGETDEWRDRDEGYFQNRRCGHVFKRGGTAYNNRARIFKYGEDGATFSASPYSREYIYNWPYTVPKVEVVSLPIEYKDAGIDKIPDFIWTELGIRFVREADSDKTDIHGTPTE